MDSQKILLCETFFTFISKLKRISEQKSTLSIQERVMSFIQLHALRFIKDTPNVTVSELAAELSMSSSSTAQLIDRLLTSHYIQRIHDREDRRVVHLKLTTTGETHLQSLRKIRQQQLANITEHLSEKDLQELNRIMKKLITSLEKKERNV